MRVLAAIACAGATFGCARAAPPDLVENLTDQLSRREGRAVAIGAIERKVLQGRQGACGAYYAPSDQTNRLPAGTAYFGAIDGRLVEIQHPLVDACLQAFPQLKPVA